MSEPVTNEEIEDVLTAVRRLISESGTAPQATSEVPAATPAPDQGRLVLTPAFRVDVPDTAPAAATPNGSEVDTLVQEAVAEEVGSVAEAAVAEALGARDSRADARAAAISLEDRIAELEAVVNEDLPHPSEEGEEDAPSEPTPDAAQADPDEVPEAPVAVDVVAEDEPPFADNVIFHTAGAGAFQSKPDGQDDPSPEAQDWEDVEDTAPTFAPVEDVAEVYADDGDAADAYGVVDESDDLVVDEDVLREIVGRLVREELQSTMGERITRNLRRMVRREIARALALKDVD